MAEKYEPRDFNWNSGEDGPLDLDKGYVLVKKGFLGIIKAAVVELRDNLEVASYKTITRNLENLSDKDILILIDYFEQRRMAQEVKLLESELTYRKKLLLDKSLQRPKNLKTVIKYNIKKKDNTIKRYRANKKVKKPKKDFILLPTAQRELEEIKFAELGFKIAPKFNVINPTKYVRAMAKTKLDERELVKKIHLGLLKILTSYLKSSSRLSKKGKGADYKFSLDEDLFSDVEFMNQIILFGNKYGIEFESMPLIYTNKKEFELQLEKEGLNDEQVTRVVTRESTLAEEKAQIELENKKRMIQEFKEYGISCDENGILNPIYRDIIMEIREIADMDEDISIFDLSNEEIIELSKIQTKVRKR